MDSGSALRLARLTACIRLHSSDRDAPGESPLLPWRQQHDAGLLREFTLPAARARNAATTTTTPANWMTMEQKSKRKPQSDFSTCDLQ